MSRIVHTTLSRDAQGQVIHLPDAVAFPGQVHQVDIVAIGQTRIITPAGMSWKAFFENLPHDIGDTAFERMQPDAQDRDPL